MFSATHTDIAPISAPGLTLSNVTPVTAEKIIKLKFPLFDDYN